jgi:alcohol dehydrogenase class IV
MERFDWRDGERTIHFGRGRAAEAVELVGGPGFTLVTTQRAQGDLPALAEAADTVLDVPAGRVDEVAGELLPGLRGDRFVALGGGRVIDVAKALTAARRREEPEARTMAVPTTLSGAEMTWVHRHAAGVPADTPRKRPAIVVCDPALAASQPEDQLAGSALNALGHALEAPATTLANPVATLAAREAAQLIFHAYEFKPGAAGPICDLAAEPDRDALALGALLAGYAIDSAWYGLHHVLSQTLVRICGIPHGSANAIMLQHTVEPLGDRTGDEIWPETITRICALTGATRLSALGVTAEQLDACADAAAERQELNLTPPPLGRDEIRALYEAAL